MCMLLWIENSLNSPRQLLAKKVSTLAQEIEHRYIHSIDVIYHVMRKYVMAPLQEAVALVTALEHVQDQRVNTHVTPTTSRLVVVTSGSPLGSQIIFIQQINMTFFVCIQENFPTPILRFLQEVISKQTSKKEDALYWYEYSINHINPCAHLVTYPKISLGQACLTQWFFRDRLLKKEVHLIDMSILSILISLVPRYHNSLAFFLFFILSHIHAIGNPTSAGDVVDCWRPPQQQNPSKFKFWYCPFSFFLFLVDTILGARKIQ